jgi:hypothetical protein
MINAERCLQVEKSLALIIDLDNFAQQGALKINTPNTEFAFMCQNYVEMVKNECANFKDNYLFSSLPKPFQHTNVE